MRARICIGILGLTLLLSACTVDGLLKKANRLYGYGEYYTAAAQFGNVYRRLNANEKTTKALVAFRRGECFRKLNQPAKAEAEYKKALRYRPNDDTTRLRLAQTLHKNAKYEEAARSYEAYLAFHPEDTLALNGLMACHRVGTWAKETSRYIVRKATLFNSTKGDFCPSLQPEDYTTLFFTSSSRLKKDKKPSSITGLPDNDFWTSRMDVTKKWTKPECVQGSINSDFDEGAGTFSSDGKTFYFTRCVTKSDSIQNSSQAELFRATRSGSEWSTPEKLRVHRDSTAVFAHPAVSPDGLWLYFVSDVKGGYGGKDLWRCPIEKNGFGPIENLGAEINTAGDELFPSFRADGTLYFSSDGLPGFGGLDLFKAVPDSATGWKVDNLLSPINSSGDDFGITFFGNEDRGYFSSNRKEVKGYDKIYSFELPSPNAEIKGVVLDRFGEPVPDATLRVVNDKGLNTKTRADKNGRYTLSVEKEANYALLATCRSYLNSAEQCYIPKTNSDSAYVVDFSLTPLHKAIRMENVLFEFGKWELTASSVTALDELLKILNDNPHIVVEIGAHTDRVGTEAYNDSLSARRAESVVKYLISRGIDTERLQAHGYGKSQPVVVDSYLHDRFVVFKEGTELSESFLETLSPKQQELADQINRRCEFKVLKTTYRLF
jgi:peptidoglycan-associated lipoprotein